MLFLSTWIPLKNFNLNSSHWLYRKRREKARSEQNIIAGIEDDIVHYQDRINYYCFMGWSTSLTIISIIFQDAIYTKVRSMQKFTNMDNLEINWKKRIGRKKENKKSLLLTWFSFFQRLRTGESSLDQISLSNLQPAVTDLPKIFNCEITWKKKIISSYKWKWLHSEGNSIDIKIATFSL